MTHFTDLPLVILAAGVGSRYGGLKQLAPVGPAGEALLEYSVYDAIRAGFTRVVLVVRAETEATFRARLDTMAKRVQVDYAHQSLDDLPPGMALPEGRLKPWGTGQAVLAAAAGIDGPFGVINADDFYGAGAYRALAGFMAAGRSQKAAVVGFPVGLTLSEAGPVSRALCQTDPQDRLKKIVEIKTVWRHNGRVVYRDAEGSERTLQEEKLVSMNMWGFPQSLILRLRQHYEAFLTQSSHLPDAEFLLPDAVQNVMQGTPLQVDVLRGSGPWCGLTFSEDEARTVALLSSLVAEGHYPETLWA